MLAGVMNLGSLVASKAWLNAALRRQRFLSLHYASSDNFPNGPTTWTESSHKDERDETHAYMNSEDSSNRSASLREMQGSISRPQPIPYSHLRNKRVRGPITAALSPLV